MSDEDAERESRDFLEAARGAPAALFRLRLSSRGVFSLPFVAPSFMSRYGLDLADPIEAAVRFFSRVHPDDLTSMREAAARSARGLEFIEIEFRFRLPSGAETWVEARAQPERAANGDVVWNGIATDVARRKAAELALRGSERRYRALFAANPHPMWFFDTETLAFLEVNDAAVAHYGYTREEFLAMTIADIRPPEDVPRMRAAVGRTTNGALDHAGVWRQRKKDGSPILVEITSDLVEHQGRRAELVLAHDVTARVEAEEALRRSEWQLRTMFDVAPVGVAQTDPVTGRWLAVNPRMCLITGYTADEMLKMRLSEITHPDDRGKDWELFQAVVRGEAPDYRMEKRYIRKDGSTAWVSVNMAVLRDDAGRPIRGFGFIEDVTVRRTAEAKVIRLNSELAEALAWQREIFEGSRDAIFLSDEDGRFVAVNQAAGELTGYSKSELSRMAIPDLHDGSDLGPYRAFHQRIIDGERVLSAAPIRRKDGAKVAAEFNNSLVVIGGRRLVLTVARDVGERVRLEEQLRQSQKMEAVGQLAGGVAHDFNNALMVISGNAELVLSETPPDDPRRSPLVDIRKSSERAASLTQQLLAFGRKQMLAPRVVDVHEVISGVERMLQRLLGEHVTLTTELGADPSWVKIDSPQLEQAIVNLALNARDAMPRGGRITIRTRTLDPSPPDAAGQRRVAISVSDTGDGIPPEVRPHIFEPFFTTKEFGKGSGLGLATVYGFVKQSGGEVTVESEPGKGATFTIVFIAEAAPSPKRVSGESRRVLPRGNETILVVEDDDAVRKVVKTTLESVGYRVVEARDGIAAMGLVRAQGAKVDLVLTDIVMPGMSGREMADRLRQSRPGLPVVFMSGYSGDAAAGAGAPDTAFLQKPFTPLVLAIAVRHALDAPG